MKSAHQIADEIGMEWQRIPAQASKDAYDRRWRTIVETMRERYGREAVSEALSLIRSGMFNGSVPHEDI